MNNAWSVAFRLPCTGLRAAQPSQWTIRSVHPARANALQCSPIASAVARQRQQLLRRGFVSSSVQYAKKSKDKTASRRAPGKPEVPSKPPTSAPSAKPNLAPTASPTQDVKAEKAQVQLSQAKVATILGPGLSFDQGMELLQEIQYRRVTGSLSDKGLEFPERGEFTVQHKEKALDWLRDNYPVDEENAAAEYADELAAEHSKELEERAYRLKLYKRDDAEAEEIKEEDIVPDEDYNKIPQRPDQTRDITGESALQARKQYVEASRKKAEIQAEKEAAEYEARGEKPPEPYKGHDLVVAKKTALEDASKLKHERWRKMEDEAQYKEEELFAERSALSRLWRPTLFGLAVIGLSWTYAESYEPPKSSMRLFPYVEPAVATILGIAGINAMLFVLWRNPRAWKMMNRNFLLSAGSPGAFSVVGGLFSHQMWEHLMWNMAVLYLAGVPIHTDIGRGTFLALYLSTGICGYLTSLTYHVLTRSYISATLGASAAIFGLVGAYFTITPTRYIGVGKLGFEISDWMALVPILAWELFAFGVMRRTPNPAVNGGTDYLTHIGGLMAGVVSGLVLRRRIAEERREDEEMKGRDAFVMKPREAQ